MLFRYLLSACVFVCQKFLFSNVLPVHVDLPLLKFVLLSLFPFAALACLPVTGLCLVGADETEALGRGRARLWGLHSHWHLRPGQARHNHAGAQQEVWMEGKHCCILNVEGFALF